MTATVSRKMRYNGPKMTACSRQDQCCVDYKFEQVVSKSCAHCAASLKLCGTHLLAHDLTRGTTEFRRDFCLRVPTVLHPPPAPPPAHREKERERAKHKNACARGQENRGGLHGRLIPGRILVQLVPKSLNVFTSPLHSVTTS